MHMLPYSFHEPKVSAVNGNWSYLIPTPKTAINDDKPTAGPLTGTKILSETRLAPPTRQLNQLDSSVLPLGYSRRPAASPAWL